MEWNLRLYEYIKSLVLSFGFLENFLTVIKGWWKQKISTENWHHYYDHIYSGGSETFEANLWEELEKFVKTG